MLDLFKNKEEVIQVIFSQEVLEDPNYDEKNLVEVSQVPIHGLVYDLLASQISWKLPGVTANKAKIVIVHKRRLPVILASHQFIIRGEIYYGWRQNGKLQYRNYGEEYLQLYVYNT